MVRRTRAVVTEFRRPASDFAISSSSKSSVGNKLKLAELLSSCFVPIQVKQKDVVGRPDIDAFEAVMMREERKLGHFVAFDFSGDARFEMDRFQRTFWPKATRIGSRIGMTDRGKRPRIFLWRADGARWQAAACHEQDHFHADVRPGSRDL